MSEMVERIAKAIIPMAWSDLAETWHADAVREARAEAMRMARAAIEAMPPSSNAMDVAGCEYLRNNSLDVSGCFEAMISAALSQPIKAGDRE